MLRKCLFFHYFFIYALILKTNICSITEKEFFTEKEKQLIYSDTSTLKLKMRSKLKCVHECVRREECCAVGFNSLTKECIVGISGCCNILTTLDIYSMILWKEPGGLLFENNKDRWASYGNTCYFFSDEYKTWDDAQAHCNSYGGYLIEIYNTDINEFIVDILRNNYAGISHFYIGATDNTNPGKYIWDNSKQELIFTYWGYNQPNYHQEHCLAIEADDTWRWHDFGCYGVFRFICEFKN